MSRFFHFYDLLKMKYSDKYSKWVLMKYSDKLTYNKMKSDVAYSDVRKLVIISFGEQSIARRTSEPGLHVSIENVIPFLT